MPRRYHRTPETEATPPVEIATKDARVSYHPKSSTPNVDVVSPIQIQYRPPATLRQLRSHRHQRPLTLQSPRLLPTATSVSNHADSVSPTTPPYLPSSKMPWLYIVFGFFGVAALACLAYAKSKLKAPIAAQPTFYRAFRLERSTEPPENIAISYELRFNSNVSAGQDRVETHGATLIQRRKKQ